MPGVGGIRLHTLTFQSVRPGGPRTGLCSSNTPDTSAEYFRVGKSAEASKLYSNPAPDSSPTPALPLLNQKLTPGKWVGLVLTMLCKTSENLSSFIAAPPCPPFSGAHARVFSELGTHVLQNACFPQIFSSNYQVPWERTPSEGALSVPSLSATLGNPVIAVFLLPEKSPVL